MNIQIELTHATAEKYDDHLTLLWLSLTQA